MANSKFDKRVKTIGAITTTALMTGGGSGSPTPMLELPKQAVIAVGDVALCVSIYTIWFDARISPSEMGELLLDAGLATVAAGMLVYGGVKLTEGLLAEGLNVLGPLGWGVKAMITGTVTGMVGFMFWMLCESPPEWLKARVA
jgi:hypothetical protein